MCNFLPEEADIFGRAPETCLSSDEGKQNVCCEVTLVVKDEGSCGYVSGILPNTDDIQAEVYLQPLYWHGHLPI